MRAAPALEIHFPAGVGSRDLADRLLAVLDDFQPIAIDEGTHEPGADDAPPRAWRVYFAAPGDRDRAARALAGLPGAPDLVVRAVDVEDENWVERSQAQLTAVRVGRIVVAPPWDRPSGTDALVVVIRPSMGFGTGHHATTRLCLRELQRLDPAGRAVIDAGTGSGVLAIGAAMLGATSVAAFDCDPDALANARENAEASGVADRVDFHLSNLANAPGLAMAPADIVLANLTAGVVQTHAATLGRLVSAGGALVISGILVDQVAAVTAALEREGLAVAGSDQEDEWVVVTLRVGQM